MSQEKEDLLVAVRARVREPVHPASPDAGRVMSSPGAAASASLSMPSASPVPGRRSPGFSGESEPESDALFAGIDLGTSRSKICASNGRRATVPSVVGWPKDPIARQYLGQEIVFGEDALRHRLSLEVCHPVDAGVIHLDGDERVAAGRGAAAGAAQTRSAEAVSQLLRHLVRLVQPRTGQKVYATLATPGQISASHRKALIEAARGAFDRVHVTSQPFAVAYSIQSLQHALLVDIGAGTTDLCRVHGSLPEETDHLTLREAGDSVDRALSTLLRQKYDKAQFSIGQIREYKERFATVLQAAEPIQVVFAVQGHPTPHEITEELRKACRTLVTPLTNAILQMVGSYDPEFQADLKSQVWLAGGGSRIAGLPQVLEDGLSSLGPGVQVRRVEDPVYAAADGALRLAQTMPVNYWEVPAQGG
ncbi:MAG: rod shape-determining protein [Planctomycetes bacterium]|nr:rod shape-determining protein [Planctomycetota bacterium]